MKNLIVCCDGTWNDEHNQDDGVAAPTNVRKIFEAAKDNAPNIQQTRYQSGVGTAGSLDSISGGLLGTGLSEDIRDCYQWLSDKYSPGDKVFLFGFSRGAFCARSLAGMIGALGLIDFSIDSDMSRARLVEKVYFEGYREKKDLTRELPFHSNSKNIQFVGVFDTVGALGVPDDKQILNVFDSPTKYRFHDAKLGDHINVARHAVALDERRGSFTPTLWENITEHNDAKQLWFPGVHSDIGGGYREKGLSDCTLEWMTNEAKAAGMYFDARQLAQIKPDEKGELHNSYTGVMKMLRTAPRSIPNVASSCLKTGLSTFARERIATPPIDQGQYLKTKEFQNDVVIVDIYAIHRWYWTGIYLEPGYVYNATATGEWVDSSIPCPPSGTSDGRFYIGEMIHLAGNLAAKGEALWKKLTNNERADFFGTKRVEHADWFELIGAVANGGNPEVDGTHSQLETIILGAKKSFEVTKGGYFYCFANDAWAFYQNNRGYVTLEIKRVGSNH